MDEEFSRSSSGKKKRHKNKKARDPNAVTLKTLKDGSRFEFVPFPKMEGKQFFIDAFASPKNSHIKLDHYKWIVLEKIHGANFAFYCNGKSIICSKRTSLLGESEQFFGYQTVLEQYREKVFRLFKELSTHVHEKSHQEITSMVIFGELFGGFYPHPDVKDLGHRPIQREIYYSDKIDFYGYDVWVTTRDDERYWLDYDVAMRHFTSCGFLHASPLLVGSFNECIKFKYNMNSTLPARLGLPPLEKNICEGVVVKSVEPCMLGGERVIFKMKNANFEEINPRHNTLYELNHVPTNQALRVVTENLDRYINHNRMMAARSKIGQITPENMDAVADLLYTDVLADFCADFQRVWDMIPDQQKKVSQELKKKTLAFVNEWATKNEK